MNGAPPHIREMLQRAAREAARGSTDPAYVAVGRRRYPFSSYRQVSEAYRSTIERLGLGGSQTPPCTIHARDGRKVANVAYNGRVFAALPDGESDYDRVLHETRRPS